MLQDFVPLSSTLSGCRQKHHQVAEGERASGERQLFQAQLPFLLEVCDFIYSAHTFLQVTSRYFL